MRARVALIPTILGLAMAVSAAPVTAGVPVGSADVLLTKTDSPDPVLAGGSITYTFIIQNLGPDDAANVVMNDLFPPGVTPDLVTAIPSATSCTISSQVLSCFRAIPLTVADGPQQIIVQASLDAGIPAGTNIVNTASVTSATTDPNPANNVASATTLVGPVADLSITKADAPDPVLSGGSFVYTVTFQNLGPDPALDVEVNDTIPVGLTVDFIQVSGAWGGVTAITNGNHRRFVFDDPMPVGTIATITFDVTVDAGTSLGTNFGNTATVSSSTLDPNMSNNAATAQTLVGPVITPAPTVVASLVDAATVNAGPGSSWIALGFAALLIGTLGVLVVANARGVARRR